ncbi:hypothetical protein EG68_02154 [Paragonimus skrjabini miyazakii]|uniref:Uncharacterized protein n=1 Tax=Paragonimus skrjabini miyazakii TaxID=59628 RepID=A0A8S9Z9Z8_9TREM|nr:hypothetical protein EG68_02154 [Paragonimus skrjabini miyazakii]
MASAEWFIPTSDETTRRYKDLGTVGFLLDVYSPVDWRMASFVNQIDSTIHFIKTPQTSGNHLLTRKSISVLGKTKYRTPAVIRYNGWPLDRIQTKQLPIAQP